MKKVSKRDLDDIHYTARQYFIDDTKIPDMDDQQFRTQCFIKAVCMFLHIHDVEFPVQKNCESIDD